MSEVYDFEIEYLAEVLAWLKDAPQDQTSFNMYIHSVRLEIDGAPFGVFTDHGDEGWCWHRGESK